MIDLDATLDNMLAGIDWRPGDGDISLSDIADERLYRSSPCRLSIRWRPSEPDIIVRLFLVYLRKFPLASFDSIFHDIVHPVKHGKGNAIKRGHGGDPEKPVLFDNYFTKDGAVVAVTDQGKGFDYRQTVALLERKVQYFNHHGAGFRSFAKCRSTISYSDGGRTLLVQYRTDRAPVAAASGDCYAAAGEGPAPVDIVESLPHKRPLHFLYYLARCEPELLHAVWKSPKFVETYIYPALPERRRTAGGTVEGGAELIDADEESAASRYRLADGPIMAKFYRRGEQGAMTHAILRAAWLGGLGPGQPYQVPRPLAYYPERRLLVTAAVDGIGLKECMAGDPEAFVRACREAARWLLRFHATPFPPADERTAALECLAPAESASAAPRDARNGGESNSAYAALLDELWAEHEQCVQAARWAAYVLVPVHGDFRPAHIRFADGVTVASEFDRSGLGDPASDVACFAYRMWKWTFRSTRDWRLAKIGTNAFLAEYGAGKPEHLGRVAHYWGEWVLESLDRHTRYKPRSDATESFDHAVAFHIEQFKSACGCATGSRVSGKVEKETAVESRMNAGSGE